MVFHLLLGDGGEVVIKKTMRILFITQQICLSLSLIPHTYASTTTTSLKPDSAKECAICHFGWTENFFYEKKSTEIAACPDSPQVATAEMCYSCHDGSTVDSRQSVFNDRRHQAGIVPSKEVKIPAIFPLDEEGKMDCGTCHSAHGVSTLPGIEKTIFLRTTNENSEMCVMCHVDKNKDLKRDITPLKRLPLKASRKLPNMAVLSGLNQSG